MAGIPVLLLTGTVGAGKTTLAYEINDVLAERQVPNAAIDLDALTAHWPWTSKWNADLMFENLALLWPNYRAHGATHLVLANVLEDPDDIARYHQAVPGAEVTIVRVLAAPALREERLIGRMPPGPSREWHLHRTVELESILERASFEHFTVDNGHRSVRDVAIEILRRVKWIPPD